MSAPPRLSVAEGLRVSRRCHFRALLGDENFSKFQIQVKHLADGERKSVEAQSSDSVEELVTSLSGFSRVMDALIRSKKPIVGHNLLVDVLSCYHHFYDAAPSESVMAIRPVRFTRDFWLKFKLLSFLCLPVARY